MTTTPETIIVETAKVACSGDAASAHPRVFLTLGATGEVSCPYCGKRFVLKAGASAGSAH